MFEQNVIWLGTVLGDNSIEDFEKYFLKEFGYHVKYKDEFVLKNNCFENELNCIIFGICEKEISKFAIFKIKMGDMRWWEDFCNDKIMSENTPVEILNKFPKTW